LEDFVTIAEFANIASYLEDPKTFVEASARYDA